jgi:predicted ArsR family transcriptional regulator
VEPNSSVREYSGLVAALATHIERTSEDPAEEALVAGVAWGVATAGQIKPLAHDGKAAIIAQLSSLGFQPKPDPVGEQIALMRCPLLDAAKRNPEIVCNVHLGLVRGMLEVIDSDDVSADLDAFAVPGACILHVQQDVDKASKRPATINREEATRR